jgi:Xaa-Pro dipeptidase
MRSYRLGRVQRILRDNDCSAALLSNPVNVRYAIDARNMTVWLLHNTARYCLLPVDGRAVLFEFPNHNCMSMAEGLPAIAEIRPACEFSFAGAGEHAGKQSQRWAAEIADTIYELTGQRGGRLAVDRCDVVGMRALEGQGFAPVEGQRIVELARAIKSADEIACMRQALDVADVGIERMRSVLAPGMQENELWAELHHTNISLGGEWIETRLLSSGRRTNPWFQECSERVITAGDLVSFDTDLIGPFGYCADISRTMFCGPGAPSPEQRTLYALALEQVRFNCNLLRPGLGFRELTESAWKIPPRYVAQNYGCVAHGVGMVDEWPLITSDPNDSALQEGELVPGMTLCVESYMGEVGGACGVKLEQQIQITATGWELLSSPLRDDSLTG